ncbi:MAG: D-aminoacylase, partial [Gemmatimonadaceae bacterium]|nr:D-aminoacylase [Gemmatimonadaceae bacterium]
MLVLSALLSPGVLTAQSARYDVILRGGTVIDGTGAAPRRADVAIRGDRIVLVGDVRSA